MNLPNQTDVIIVGGGPCGLMLANELGRRGVTCVLVDEKPTTAFNPQANATQARTMEHFRRLGFAGKIRQMGMPPDYPTDIAYFTRYAKHELARFKLPSSRQATDVIRTLSGSWSAAELPHRISQKYVEAELRRQAEKLPGVSINYGVRVTSFAQDATGVDADVELATGGGAQRIRGRWLVGADGPRSFVRETLGYRLEGDSGVNRDFMGGRMFAVYARIPDYYRVVPHDPAWMNVTFNQQRRALLAAVDGVSEFAFHTQLRPHEEGLELTDAHAADMVRQAIGADTHVDVLSNGMWRAGFALVAEKMQKGRVFIAGDAAHLFTPTGGLGYNTAIEDSVNLGWKFAAVVKGVAPESFLDSYEAERRPFAKRNTGYSKLFADSLGLKFAPAEIEDESPQGEAARAEAGEYFNAHARREFNIPGVTFGGRYDGSPIIVSDGTSPPPDAPNIYQPTACPGGRPPHLWLDGARSLYDTFGFEWTLLRLGRHAPDVSAFAKSAKARGLDLSIVDIAGEEARDLYEADLALIRPDQIVAWRGHDTGRADAILAQATGR